MKRWLCIFLAMLLPACAPAETAATPAPSGTADSIVEGGYTAPATPEPSPTPELPPLREDPMLLHAVEIAHRIDLLAENERFMNTYTYGMMTREQIDAVSAGDHARPQRCFHLPGERLIEALYAGSDAAALDFDRCELRRDLVSELPELLLGRREEVERSLIFLLARYKVFALEGAAGCGAYFMLYGDATPVIVTWYAEEDCVSEAAFFLPDQDLTKVTSAEEMSAWFSAKGMPMVRFEEVPLT